MLHCRIKAIADLQFISFVLAHMDFSSSHPFKQMEKTFCDFQYIPDELQAMFYAQKKMFWNVCFCN